MTVKEFFNWCEKHQCEDYEMVVSVSDGTTRPNIQTLFPDKRTERLYFDYENVFCFDKLPTGAFTNLHEILEGCAK